MQIADGARKHGIAEPDMLHAARNGIADLPQAGGELVLIIGPDRAGNLLEVVIAGPDSDDPAVIHATPLRRRFRYLLR